MNDKLTIEDLNELIKTECQIKRKIQSELDKIYHEVCCAGGNDYIETAIINIEILLKKI